MVMTPVDAPQLVPIVIVKAAVPLLFETLGDVQKPEEMAGAVEELAALASCRPVVFTGPETLTTPEPCGTRLIPTLVSVPAAAIVTALLPEIPPETLTRSTALATCGTRRGAWDEACRRGVSRPLLRFDLGLLLGLQLIALGRAV